MSGGWNLDTPGQKLGQFIFWIPMVLCSMEIVPGWGMLHLGWPPEVYYAIMAVCGAIAGFLIAPAYRGAGFTGGLFAGAGGLFAAALFLENTTETHTAIIVCITLLGCLPGIGIGFGLAALQDLFRLPPESGPPLPLADDARRPWSQPKAPPISDRTTRRRDDLQTRD